MELGIIRRIVSGLRDGLEEDERARLEFAAEAAENIFGISPKTEFIARLENGLFHKVLEAYRNLER